MSQFAIQFGTDFPGRHDHPGENQPITDARTQNNRYRNLVERFFNKIKHYRAVVTRYDKRADNFSRESNSLQSASGCDLTIR